jgi:hypothetical protein
MIRLLHYTSRQGAQDISSSGCLRAGPSSRICLTSTKCESGWEAAAGLSIPDRPVEFFCALDVLDGSVSGPMVAHPLFAIDGTLLRPGGWPEYHLNEPVLYLESPPKWEALNGP